MSLLELKKEADALPAPLKKLVQSARNSLSVSAGIANNSWAKVLVGKTEKELEQSGSITRLLDPKKWRSSVRELSQLAIHTNDEACFRALNILVRDLKQREGWMGVWARSEGLPQIARQIPKLLESEARETYSEDHTLYAWESEDKHVWTVRFLDDVKKLIMECSNQGGTELQTKVWKREMFRSPYRDDGINYTNAQNSPWWSRFLVAPGRLGEVGRAWFANELSTLRSGEELWKRSDWTGNESAEYAAPWRLIHQYEHSLLLGYKTKKEEAASWVDACVRAYTSRERNEVITPRSVDDFSNVFESNIDNAQKKALIKTSFGFALLAFQKRLLNHNISFRNEWARSGWQKTLENPFEGVKAWVDAFQSVGKELSQEEWEKGWLPFDTAVNAIGQQASGTLASQFFRGVVWPSSKNSNLDCQTLEAALRDFKQRWVHDREYALLRERALGSVKPSASSRPAL